MPIKKILTSANFPKSLCLTLLIISVIETGVYLHARQIPAEVDKLLEQRFYPPNRIPALEESIIQWQVYHAMSAEEEIDILLLGDSSSLMGLRPKIIQKQTGLTAWGIGTLDYTGTPGNVDILETYLQRRPAPKILVYHIISWSFNLSEADLQRFGYLERLRTWMATGLQTTTASTSSGFALPSMRYRRNAQQLLTTFSTKDKEEWLNAPRGPYPSDNEIRQTLLKNQGAMTEVVHEDEVNHPRDLRGYLRIDPSLIDDIRRLMAICEQRSIQLVIVANPLPESGATPENLAGLAALETQLRDLSKGQPHVTLFAPFTRVYPVALCASYNHLTEEGAKQNSRELSDWLLPRLAKLAQ
ncbi:hypothetical protein U14_02180 [Candidatus Moduliflexus flocculans]|uniref:Uncharacterized protein n=1 Tax=Candidatus Moduliflexus flocculans TaxID=1499966 RepID=A0A0S6VTR1_9BACT|nr:hypothetical protein U14_02180 [Candidatus Moduliflexus flocculans]